ncbi:MULTISPECIES: GlxA family transcriptional regulator [Cupriavidus]|uniref:GlxA family transcriptional regulator n=1 Tax=Cupriavidus sp. WS TaxID=1312922 RepID=UPI00036887C0|nr:helix-turn-helix domain-containing protein [Cupriavidus sp. WS]
MTACADPTALPPAAAPPPRAVPLRVRLLWLPDAMPGMLFGALDVLRTAAGVARLQRPDADPGLSWSVIGPGGRALSLPALGLEPSRRRRGGEDGNALVVVPGVHARNAPHLEEIVSGAGPALRLLERHAQAGGWIAAGECGIAFPAELGLLDGARMGAPWPFQSWMARRYPRCDFSASEPMSVHQRVFGCVAPALQTEFMLRVLGHLHDPDLAQACSRLLLYQAGRQQLTPELVSQRWLSRTADSPVYRAMRWLQANVDAPYRLAQVAEAAAVSERTLLRHFRQVSGMSPLDYLHTLRVERAKTLLEVTLHGAQAVAEACGYSDAAAFRRLFQRATGMSMSNYRARFALRAQRRYWRVEDMARATGGA